MLVQYLMCSLCFKKAYSQEVVWNAGAEFSQAELIKRAFAGDDVQADFEATKAAEVEEELPKQVHIH